MLFYIRDETMVIAVLSIVMEQSMKVRRPRQGPGTQPKQEH
jgi:hypothetical protein